MTQDEIVARSVRKVRLFIDAWQAVDPDVAMACLSNDIVYINQPLEPVVGQDDVRKIVAGIMQLSHPYGDSYYSMQSSDGLKASVRIC